MFLYLK